MTFESTPPDYSSVNDSLVYVVYDSNAADPVTYPNYKYVGELWIDGVKVFTKRLFPHPDTNRGIFDFGSVIREYVVASLAPTGTGILAQEVAQGEWATKAVDVKIREEYNGTVGAVVEEYDAKIYYNHYNGRFNDFTILDTYADAITSTRPLRPINLLLSANSYYIPYFANTSTHINIVFDVNGTTHTYNLTPTATTLQLLNISPGAVNAEFGAGTIDDTIESYTVKVGTADPYTVNVVCPGFHTNYLVHFLNKFGGFESMLFNKAHRKTYEVDRKKWQQLPYRVDGSGVVSVKTGSIMHSQQSTFASKFKEALKLSTDWLTDAEYQWLAELVTSPIIYVEDAGTLYPVTMADTNYEFKEWIVDNLTNLSINVEFGTSYKTQFT